MRGKDLLQRLIRNRMARLGLAFGLIVLSAWAFLPHLSYRIASSAFVNAELVRVAAPIAGRLTRDLPRKGDFIEKPPTCRWSKRCRAINRHLLHLDQPTCRRQGARRACAQAAGADRDGRPGALPSARRSIVKA